MSNSSSSRKRPSASPPAEEQQEEGEKLSKRRKSQEEEQRSSDNDKENNTGSSSDRRRGRVDDDDPATGLSQNNDLEGEIIDSQQQKNDEPKVEEEELEEEEEKEEEEEYQQQDDGDDKDNEEDIVVNEEEEEEMDEEEEEEEDDENEGTAAGAANNTTSVQKALGRKKPTSVAGAGQSRDRPAEAGIIKTVYVENFMCHRKLRVDLNRNVNFIYGQNGSGKSAVLAAIQICLGAGARRTHRARAMKDLVRRDGASSALPSNAKIEVTLLNRGSDAYKPDVYGDTITVQRTIALKGGFNGYKLLDHQHKERSEKGKAKHELDEMLDHLNIQVDNPVAVLDQEEAKKFLMGKAEDKYNFFMKATELERVNRTYSNTLDRIAELESMNKRMKEGMEVLVEHVAALKKNWKEHQELGKLESKLIKLKTEWAWAYYNEVDEALSNKLQERETYEEKLRKRREELAKLEASASDDNDGQGKADRVDELLKEAEDQGQLKHQLDEEQKEAEKPFKEAERKLKSLKKQQKIAEKGLREAVQKLQEVRDQIIANASSAESDEARRTAALQKAEEELAAARAKVDELKQKVSHWLRQYEEIGPSVQEARSEVERLSNSLRGIQSTIQKLQSSSDPMALLGPRVAAVSNLVKEAKRKKKFRGQVVGPIAAFAKIAPGMQDFASVAEHALGTGVLDRFIVTNDHDNKMMRDIRRKAGCSSDCGIYQIHPQGRYNIPTPPQIDGIETVANVINIENDIVFNCLVDNCKIEKKAVARDRRYSEQKLLFNEGNNCQIRGGIKEVYFLPKGDHWTVKNGSFATFSNDRSLRQTIGVDQTAAIAEAQKDEAERRETLKSAKQEENKLNHEHSVAQSEWNKAKKTLQHNDARINQLTEKIDTIKTEIASNSASAQAIDTTEFEDDVQQAEAVVEKLKADVQALVAEQKEYLPGIQDVKRRLQECTERNNKVLEDINAAQNDLTQFIETQSQHKGIIEKKKQKIQKFEEVLSKQTEVIEQHTENRDVALEKARKMHFRFEQAQEAEKCEQSESDDGPPDDIRAEPTQEEVEAIEPLTVKHNMNWYQVRIDTTKKKIENERERRNVSREDAATAYEKYSKAKADLEQKVKASDETESLIDELDRDVKRRRHTWKAFRRHLTKITSDRFDETLTLNKFSGSLKFDHDNLALDLAVQKNSADAKSETKDVKALSGGERSFTTMCLLLALGETLETPFRILDEFDVFLDAEVRKLTIQSLIHVAKKLKHRQFIFITPQDLSGVQQDSELKILKLRPPDRHDNAGGPTQQTLNLSQAS